MLPYHGDSLTKTALCASSMLSPLHEYQKKRLTEKAFRKRLILMGSNIAVLDWQEPKASPKKEKRERGSRGPNRVFSKLNST